jgi:LuxR family transcriptional regulator, maltose regulon positive regulatory protein
MYSLRSTRREVLDTSRHEFAGSLGNDSIVLPHNRLSPSRLNERKVKIAIRCLGHFFLHQSPKSPAIPLKLKSRPTALLHLLIVAGPQGVEKNVAELNLWPQTQAALGNSTLDTTLYRLRKLVGNEQSVRVTRGRIVLDDRCVSIDAWDFATEAETLCTRLQSSANTLDGAEISGRCERLFDLYQGHFLAQELQARWVVQMRDALRFKFFHTIKLVAAYWQTTGHWNRAAQLYERALELDNLAEEFHRELMRCHLARHEFADAVRVFRRCRELLSLVLGVMPSDATEALYRQAFAGQAPQEFIRKV